MIFVRMRVVPLAVAGKPLRGIAFEPIAIFPVEAGEKQLAITLP